MDRLDLDSITGGLFCLNGILAFRYAAAAGITPEQTRQLALALSRFWRHFEQTIPKPWIVDGAVAIGTAAYIYIPVVNPQLGAMLAAMLPLGPPGEAAGQAPGEAPGQAPGEAAHANGQAPPAAADHAAVE